MEYTGHERIDQTLHDALLGQTDALMEPGVDIGSDNSTGLGSLPAVVAFELGGWNGPSETCVHQPPLHLDALNGDVPAAPSPSSHESDGQKMNVWLVGQQVSRTQRRERYEPESYVHPAKMLPETARRIIETYSEEGELVVDLMSGIGTTGVEALWLNRRYVGVEIEESYAQLHQDNVNLAITQGAPSTKAQVICGDARTDHKIRGATLVTFSPPYQDAIHYQGDDLGRIRRKIENGTASPQLLRRFGRWIDEKEPARAGTRPDGYSSDPSNVGHFQGPKYWEAMEQIFSRAFEALNDGGYLVVVTKDQRDRKTGELINLYGATVDVCRQLGFRLHQHVVAILCGINPDTGAVTARTSHWQRLAVRTGKEKGNIVLLGQYEDVAVFRKPVPL